MGVDVGGSGIKGAIVDLDTGELAGDRHKIATPQPATPAAVAATVAEVVQQAGWTGPAGCTLPGVVRGGVLHTAANIDPAWVGVDAAGLFGDAVGAPVTVRNDADAAGIAEMRWGAGRGRGGVVLLLTFGTGIGSALFTDGRLVPNTELGHLEMWGSDAEKRAAANARKDDALSYEAWAARVDEYLDYVERLLWPDLIIFGGGVSRKHDQFFHYLSTRAELVPAQLRNNAGIAGVALAAWEAS